MDPDVEVWGFDPRYERATYRAPDGEVLKVEIRPRDGNVQGATRPLLRRVEPWAVRLLVLLLVLALLRALVGEPLHLAPDLSYVVPVAMSVAMQSVGAGQAVVEE